GPLSKSLGSSRWAVRQGSPGGPKFGEVLDLGAEVLGGLGQFALQPRLLLRQVAGIGLDLVAREADALGGPLHAPIAVGGAGRDRKPAESAVQPAHQRLDAIDEAGVLLRGEVGAALL